MTDTLKSTKLNKRQRKCVNALAKTGSTMKAADISGYDHSYVSWLKKQPHIQTALQEALRKENLDDKRIAKTIDKGLKATYVKKDGGKAYPDFHARHKYLDTAIKIHGGYAPEKHEIRQEKLTLIVTPDCLRGLKDAGAITDEDAEAIEAEVVEEDGRTNC